MISEKYIDVLTAMCKAAECLLEIRDPIHEGYYPSDATGNLDRNLIDLMCAVNLYISLAPIEEAPLDTVIRIFGGTLIDPHWETSGVENTEGVAGFLNKERTIAQVQLSSYEVHNPTHFMLLPELQDGVFEVLKKHE